MFVVMRVAHGLHVSLLRLVGVAPVWRCVTAEFSVLRRVLLSSRMMPAFAIALFALSCVIPVRAWHEPLLAAAKVSAVGACLDDMFVLSCLYVDVPN